ncbi:MAG: hypothetical protein ACREEK_06725 [Bradyrhizobium sp.]
MSISISSSASIRGPARWLLPLCAGAGAYLFFLSAGAIMLRDSDSLWQIKVGQWILDHGAMPYTDIYSFTRFGEPWMSSSWLSQVLFALAYGPSDWAGPVILSSLAIGALVAIFIYLISPYFEPTHAIAIATLALLQSASHFLARPHMLAMPVMLAFVGGLMAAADRRSQPSWLLLPLMVLWTNLHGGFVLGLALIGPIGLAAIWETDASRRFELAARWALFGFAALAASCCTPYGWNSLLGAAKILSLGKVLSMIGEWKPVDFSSFTFFEATLLGLIGLALSGRLKLSMPRIMLLMGLIWMALTHVRNIEIFAFLAPLVLAKPIAEQFGTVGAAVTRFAAVRPPSYATILSVIAIVGAGWASTSAIVAHQQFSFTPPPVAAVEILEQRHAQRIFSTAPFGGYLISRDIKVFIDGRAELYGERFVTEYYDAIEARNVDELLRMLDAHRIDATLLDPSSPAASALDHVKGWKRLYADDIAVIHVRADRTQMGAPPAAQMQD